MVLGCEDEHWFAAGRRSPVEAGLSYVVVRTEIISLAVGLAAADWTQHIAAHNAAKAMNAVVRELCVRRVLIFAPETSLLQQSSRSSAARQSL